MYDVRKSVVGQIAFSLRGHHVVVRWLKKKNAASTSLRHRRHLCRDTKTGDSISRAIKIFYRGATESGFLALFREISDLVLGGHQG